MTLRCECGKTLYIGCYAYWHSHTFKRHPHAHSVFLTSLVFFSCVQILALKIGGPSGKASRLIFVVYIYMYIYIYKTGISAYISLYTDIEETSIIRVSLSTDVYFIYTTKSHTTPPICGHMVLYILYFICSGLQNRKKKYSRIFVKPAIYTII